jgi:uncharacterized membrane protein YjgN (DUF898 family)
MTSLELALTLVTAVVLPWLVLLGKQLSAHTKILRDVAYDVAWLKREHEPNQDGVMPWKNPGLVEAIESLRDAICNLPHKP